jgi:hypothetical protein
VLAQVFAAFVDAFALSLSVAPAAAIQLPRSNGDTGLAQRIAPPGTNVVALTMVLHMGAVLVLTAVGMLLGMLLGGLDERRPDGGLGSPNAAYTLILLASTAVIVIPVLIIPSIRKPAVAGAVLFAVAFGWGMPWLATLG